MPAGGPNTDSPLAFVQYLVDGVIADAAGIAGQMGAAGSVQIPVLSEIWQALTGAPLTVLPVLFGVVTSLGVAFDQVEGDA